MTNSDQSTGAARVAEQHGIRLDEDRGLARPPYSNLVSVTVHSADGGPHAVKVLTRVVDDLVDDGLDPDARGVAVASIVLADRQAVVDQGSDPSRHAVVIAMGDLGLPVPKQRLVYDPEEAASAARRINGFVDLDGVEFLARVDVEKDGRGDDRNIVRVAVEPDHKDYAAFMGVPSKVTPGGGASGAPAAVAPSFAGSAQVPQSRPAAPAVAGKPSWAQ